jgi:hypothetical protein
VNIIFSLIKVRVTDVVWRISSALSGDVWILLPSKGEVNAGDIAVVIQFESKKELTGRNKSRDEG